MFSFHYEQILYFFLNQSRLRVTYLLSYHTLYIHHLVFQLRGVLAYQTVLYTTKYFDSATIESEPHVLSPLFVKDMAK